ncbi:MULTISPECIES: NAD(P)-dependent alcohol dehydrogenase [unclassified Imperialibacter]|uniref:NAD(P)-dependent alcohol dehydrogenase n=1 Tax=unclassified Imperialibacter TaxID=2629706 RepID=UPI00125624C5|nr:MULTISPECIES: NAD(P)-dependent alcohol dehydrogenase [unclassified Imperialibacter]CAD5249392.1 NADPH:quinone reductase-like Zn-dependent oxidoreductase [Imperialibacter sp. 89]CAD5264469.1 NADPH:quinone reductase-like Zn-dependent oxidoreductase [Imperialibacter sp. 75]VVT06854.1 NADPH:quinone reductase [Imperialibacter sp. EC-SDR9]
MNANQMKAIVASGYGTPEVLKFTSVEKPTPGPKDVLVKVIASAATTADTMMLTGKPYIARLFIGLTKPKHPIPGTGFAGVIEAIGSEVTQFAVCDEVFGETTLGFSTNAEYVVVPANGVILPKPASLHFAEAASYCDGHLTSYNFLKRIAQVQPGQRVLVNGAAGSLGTSAIQIANYLGAHVTGVCSSKNTGLIKSLGADEVIDYQKQDFTRLTTQYDIIFDTVGKISFTKAKKVLAEPGMYLSPVLRFSLLMQMIASSLFGKKKAKFEATGANADDTLKVLLLEVVELHKNGHLKTVIDRQYPLERVAEAHHYIACGHKKGNVVIVVAA